MRIKSIRRRGFVNIVMMGSVVTATIVSALPLFFILFHTLAHGIGALNLAFITNMPVPVGETGGGFANAIAGSAVLVFIALAIGLPFGIMGGIYVAEYAGDTSAHVIRFAADMLNGTPSIVIGIFVYVAVVIPMKGFSALAGGVSLAIIMIPIVLRTTESMMLMVPRSLKEAALALGIPHWRLLVSIVLKTASSGIVTGILIAVARAAGETAPLLFTALGNQFWSVDLTEPISALPLQIFTFAISPFEEWHAQAWAGALVLIVLVFALNISARIFVKNRLRSVS